MIRTHPSCRTSHLLVSMFALTAIPTAWGLLKLGSRAACNDAPFHCSG